MATSLLRWVFVASYLTCALSNQRAKRQFSDYADYGLAMLQYNSETCLDKRTCNMGLTYPDKNCHCDKLCQVLGDCCENVPNDNDDVMMTPLPDPAQFSCLRDSSLLRDTYIYGTLVVNKCHLSWTDQGTKDLCQGRDAQSMDNIFLRSPVSSSPNGVHVMYRNMYCAYCNYEYDFQLWNAEYKCVNETDVRHIPGNPDCMLLFTPPDRDYKLRLCPRDPPINYCLPNMRPGLVSKCLSGPMSTVYTQSGTEYRNKFCAKCNNVSVDSLYCEEVMPIISATRPIIDPRVFSFRLLVDLNQPDAVQDMPSCSDNEMYDMFENICRQIFCVAPAVPAKGRCVYNDTTLPSVATIAPDFFPNCTWIKLNADEYRLDNDSKLFILSEQTVYNASDYRINGTDVYVCALENHTCSDCHGNTDNVRFTFDDVEGYVSAVGMIISIVALIVTFVIYITFPQLLNTPGKILICMVMALLLAQLLFLISSEVRDVTVVCKLIGICIHYFFLAAFCWMNVIAFDLWMTFSNKFVGSGSRNKTAKRFRLYQIYAWLIPLVIVTIAVALDFSQFDADYSSLKPGYGNGVCWISSSDALLLFFVGPLAVFKLFDIVSFIFTAVHIAKAKRQGAMARQKKNTCSLIINLKLSLIMGLTWVFAFLGNLTNSTAMWYLFIVFNTLQGLFIAISFLCTKKVWRLVSEKYVELTSTFTRSTTAGTSGNSTNMSSKSASSH